MSNFFFCHNIFNSFQRLNCHLQIHLQRFMIFQTRQCQSRLLQISHMLERLIQTLFDDCSRQLFENIVTTEEIAQNGQFLLLPQCFPLVVIGYPFNYRYFLFVEKICSKLSAAELLYEGKGVCTTFHLKLADINPFPHTTHLQQTTLKTYRQKYGKS